MIGRPPDKESRPAGNRAANRSAGAGTDTRSLPPSVDLPPFCPCGHLYDEDCLRHRPMPIMVDWVVTSTTELGLDCAHGDDCRGKVVIS